MEELLLSGQWVLRRRADGKTVEARIPGSDFGALFRAGEIKDPLFSGVDEENAAIAREDYSFVRSFAVPASLLSHAHVFFCCEWLDTLCDVYLNGQKAFSSKSAFLPVEEDVKSFLREGENEIELRFFSPVNYIENANREKPLPPNSNGINGIPYLRKSACHFGWDWGPCVPYCGAGEIRLLGFERRIENVQIRQETTSRRATVQAAAQNADSIRLFAPDGAEIAGENGSFSIENPQLWYTYELSGKETQPLYTLVFENDEMKLEKKIGLRFIELDRTADAHGENFCFLLNGKRVFAKGGNLIPFASIPEFAGEAEIDRYLALARKANFNMLRVWGGGDYASDYLLSRCDEMGILIWQDFCFACQLYPLYDEAFRELVLREVRSNVRRMEMHPSVALFCGNNEIEQCYGYMPKNHPLIRAYIEFFYEILPGEVAALTETPFIPSSPMGPAPFKDVTGDAVGDTHLWNVWHGLKKLDYYRKRKTRFLSEFGLESLPSMKSIRTFADETAFSLDSAPFMQHQKCVGGNRKMLFYLTEQFDFPRDFCDLPTLTGFVQRVCLEQAAMHLRLHKGRSNGCLIWQFNDIWNCPSWSMVDYEEIPKASFFAARAFFAPVAVFCSREGNKATFFACNDTMEEAVFTARAEQFDLDGKLLETIELPVRLAPDSVQVLQTIETKPNAVLRLRFLEHTVTVLPRAPRLLKLKSARLETKLTGNTLEITSDTFACGVHIEASSAPDDNDFSLMAGETKIITFAEPPQDCEVTCINNMAFQKNALKRVLFRLKYRLEPRNIANAVYYALN